MHLSRMMIAGVAFCEKLAKSNRCVLWMVNSLVCYVLGCDVSEYIDCCCCLMFDFGDGLFGRVVRLTNCANLAPVIIFNDLFRHCLLVRGLFCGGCALPMIVGWY